MNRLSMDEAGTLLAALWEWQHQGSDPVVQELHDRLADCAEIFLAEHEVTDDNGVNR